MLEVQALYMKYPSTTVSTTTDHLHFKEAPRESDLDGLVSLISYSPAAWSFKECPSNPLLVCGGRQGSSMVPGTCFINITHLFSSLSASSLFKFPRCQDTLAAPRCWLVSCGNCSRCFLYEVTRGPFVLSVFGNSTLSFSDFCKPGPECLCLQLRVPSHVPWLEWAMPWLHSDSLGSRRLGAWEGHRGGILTNTSHRKDNGPNCTRSFGKKI